MLKFIVAIVIIQLFYGAGMTMLSYSLPASQVTLLNTYSEPADNLDVEEISETIEENIQSQINIPLVDIGSLLFYSGNVIIDMIINFFTAVPSMVTILFSTYFMFFPIDAYIATQIKVVVWVLITIIYMVAFLSFIMSLRSGTGGMIR